MKFNVAILSRQQAQTPHSIKAFGEASPDVKELYLESTKTAGLFIVDADGYLRIAAAPEPKKAANGCIIDLRVNFSNDEFLPGKLPAMALKHFVGMAPRAQVPSAASYHRKLSTAILDRAMSGASVTMYALPVAVPIGYGKKWIEGIASDPGVQDEVEEEYGPEYKEWVRAVVSALDNQAAIADVYKRVKDAGAFAEHLGDKVTEDQLHLDEPAVAISVFTRTLQPDDYEERRQLLGPYGADASAAAPAPAVSTTSLSEAAVTKLATAMTTKDDRREAEKLHDGLVSTKAFFIAGTIDVKEGEIAALAIATMTEAFKGALSKATITERARKLKRMLDTNNRARPQGSTSAIFRDMANHDPNLVKVLVTGEFAQSPMTDINAKVKEFNIAGCLPHLQELIERLREEQVSEEFDHSVGHEGKGSAGSKRKYIVVSLDNLSYDSLKSMFANFEAIGQTMFVCDVPGKKPFVVMYAGEMLTFLLKEATRTWFVSKNSTETQGNFIFYVLQRFDEFLCKISVAGEDFTNHDAIEADDVASVDKEKFSEATEAIADDIKELKKMISRGNRIKDAPDFVGPPPSKRAATAALVAQKSAPAAQTKRVTVQSPKDGTPPTLMARLSPYAGEYQSGRSGGRGWNSSSPWGRNNSSSTWNKKREFNAEESKKKGDLIVKQEFNRPLANNLHKIYCAPYMTVGKYCGNLECDLKHRPFDRWQTDHQERQMAHVEANRDKILFNVATVKRLPPNKKHLLGTRDGPVSGEN